MRPAGISASWRGDSLSNENPSPACPIQAMARSRRVWPGFAAASGKRHAGS